MGWFSDLLYGERAKINKDKLNSFMEPYLKMITEQEDIAKQQMDPNSLLNQNMMNQMRGNTFDLANEQNNQIMENLASSGGGGVAPAQMIAAQQANSNVTGGNFANQMQSFLSNQFNTGISGLLNVANMRKGEGERLSNMHINEVNAHNARRQANMDMTTGLLGSAFKMNAMAGDRPQRWDSKAGPEGTGDWVDPARTNFWGGSWQPFQDKDSMIYNWFNK